MIKRLFCYIESNRIEKNARYNPEGYDLVEIGAILYEGDEAIKSYHKFVHPKHMELMTRERCMSLGGVEKRVLEAAAPIEDISRRFLKTFYEYDLLVMWSRKDYEILMSSLEMGGYVQAEHKPVFLKDLITVSKGLERGFLNELKAYKISTEKALFSTARYKVECLAQLYFAAKKSYSVFLKKEGFQFYKSKTENMIHQKDCPLSENTPLEYKKEVSPAELFNGYQMCPECCRKKLKPLPDRDHVRFPIKSQFEDEQIEKMCEEFDMEYSISDNIIFVKTQYSSWRIIHDGKSVLRVYHENLRRGLQNNEYAKSWFDEGFHRQHIFSHILYDVLYYIHLHDRDFLKKL